MSNSARRLQVLRRCIFLIFDNKIAEARKTFPAVLSALKTRQARLALCSELIKYKDEQGHSNNQVVLEHQQFEMIVHLVNAALQDDSGLSTKSIIFFFCSCLQSRTIERKGVFLQTHNQNLYQLFLTVSWDLRS